MTDKLREWDEQGIDTTPLSSLDIELNDMLFDEQRDLDELAAPEGGTDG